MARPMPRTAPVTNAILLASGPVMVDDCYTELLTKINRALCFAVGLVRTKKSKSPRDYDVSVAIPLPIGYLVAGMSERQNQFNTGRPALLEVRRRASLLLLSLALWANAPRPALSQETPPPTVA